MIFLTLLISLFIGFILLELLWGKDERPDLLFHLFVSGGLGLCLSGHIVFYNLLLSGEIKKPFIFLSHIILLASLSAIKLFFLKLPARRAQPFKPNRWEVIFILICLVFLVAATINAHFNPFGGWDAWTVWNFKAKFILEGGRHWTNVFDPVLTDSRPQYPLLLPLINIWNWLALSQLSYTGPMGIAVFFSLWTVGLLFVSLRRWVPDAAALIVTSALATSHIYFQWATSQYADILLSYLLLASFANLVLTLERKQTSFAILSGIFLGFLGFAKNEGLTASLILIMLAVVFILSRKNASVLVRKKLVLGLSIAFLLASLPTIIFHLNFSPGDREFINGWTSLVKPSSLLRLKIILSYLASEFLSFKWHSIWVFAFLAALAGWGRGLAGEIKFLGAFFFLYLLAIVLYYHIDTYWDILWWLKNSLTRILITLLPSFLFWSACGAFAKNHDA